MNIEKSDITSVYFSSDGNLITIGRLGEEYKGRNYGIVEVRRTMTGEIVRIKKGHENNGTPFFLKIFLY